MVTMDVLTLPKEKKILFMSLKYKNTGQSWVTWSPSTTHTLFYCFKSLYEHVRCANVCVHAHKCAYECVHVCKHALMSVNAGMRTHRTKDNLSVSLSVRHCLFAVSCCVCQANWPTSLQEVSCFCLKSHSRDPGITGTWIYMGSAYSSSGPPARPQVLYSQRHLPGPHLTLYSVRVLLFREEYL